MSDLSSLDMNIGGGTDISDSAYMPNIKPEDDFSNLRDLTNTHTDYPTTQMSRDYKCPTCGGEFNSWESGAKLEDDEVVVEDDIVGSLSRPNIEQVEACPFCLTPKGEHNED